MKHRRGVIKQNMSKEKEAVLPAKKDILSFYEADVISGVRACVESDMAVLLVGETGLGKTTLIQALADEKGKTLHRISVNGGTSAEEVLGKHGAKDGSTFWIDGLLIQAMKRGDWIVFDEINAALPEVMFALHSLLDHDKKVTLVEKDGEIVRPADGFRFFGTMNPSDDYAGTKDMNMAFMSRFNVFFIECYPMDKEIEILGTHGIADTEAQILVSLAKSLRDLKTNGTILYFCSTRDIIQAGVLHKGGLALGVAVTCAVVNKMSKEDREEIANAKVVDKVVGKKEIYKSKTEVDLERKLAEAQKSAKTEMARAAEFEADAKKYAEALKQAEIKKGGTNFDIDEKTLRALKTLGVVR